MRDLMEFWWARLPIRGSRLSRVLGAALGEGVYVTVWPRFAALAPIAALVVGLFVGWHRLGVREVFTQSPAILVIAIALGLIAGQLGLLFTIGYGVADLLIWRLAALPRGDLDRIELVVASIIAYVALGILAAGVPLAVRAVRAQTPLPSEQAPDTRVAADILLGGAAAAFLTFLYVSALPMLVRPIFVWQGRAPNVSSIEPVQDGAWLFALVAFGVGAGRVLLEYAAAVIDPPELERRASALDERPPGTWERVPPVVRVTIGAAVGTLLLAGLVITWEETAFLFAGLWLIIAARTFLPPLLPRWPAIMDRIPVIVRLVASVVIAYFIVTLVVTGRLRGVSFVPLMAGLFVALVLMALFFPASKREKATGSTAVSTPA